MVCLFGCVTCTHVGLEHTHTFTVAIYQSSSSESSENDTYSRTYSQPPPAYRTESYYGTGGKLTCCCYASAVRVCMCALRLFVAFAGCWFEQLACVSL